MTVSSLLQYKTQAFWHGILDILALDHTSLSRLPKCPVYILPFSHWVTWHSLTVPCMAVSPRTHDHLPWSISIGLVLWGLWPIHFLSLSLRIVGCTLIMTPFNVTFAVIHKMWLSGFIYLLFYCPNLSLTPSWSSCWVFLQMYMFLAFVIHILYLARSCI